MMGRFISLIAALVVFWLGTGFVTAEADDVPQARTLQVYKSATCGCCQEWMAHMQANAFEFNALHVRVVYSPAVCVERLCSLVNTEPWEEI